MKKTYLQKGFTLIELLVVIAIIGILSSVVLASLNTARGKGANAAVKANLNNIRAQAELVYDNANPNKYATVCADPNVVKAVAAATSAGGSAAICTNNDNNWSVSSPLKLHENTFTHWCVDNTGTSRGMTAINSVNEYVCSH